MSQLRTATNWQRMRGGASSRSATMRHLLLSRPTAAALSRSPATATAAPAAAFHVAARTTATTRQQRGGRGQTDALSSSSSSSFSPLLSSPSAAPSSQSLSRSFSSRLTLSPREKSVLRVLQSIRHPVTGEDLVFSGHLRSVSERSGIVSIILPLDQSYREIKKTIIDTLTGPQAASAGLEWIESVRVNMETAKEEKEKSGTSEGEKGGSARKHDGLSEVRNIIAVSSCKGGVGKSTVTVNLAYALQKLLVPDESASSSDPSSPSSSSPPLRELRIGILDADVYGPSLPTMVSPKDTTLRYDEQRRIVPPVYEGVKTMSYGYVKSSQQQAQQAQGGGGGAGSSAANAAATGAFIRGPLASAAVKQLASETDWGALDYLLVDLPPGTGDIQLTLTQLLRIRAAVVVTTPQKLSFVDVVKGLEMFDKVQIPVVALVENMSYFVCGNCDTKHRLFGDKGNEYLSEMTAKFGEKKVVEVPIWTRMAKASDSGDPFMLSNDEESAHVRALYEDLALSIHQQLGGTAQTEANIPKLTFDQSTHMLTLHTPSASPSSPALPPLQVHARDLRLACQCAGCVDEITGVSKLKPERIPQDVKPLGMQPRGNYAVAMHWSDGHASSLYPFDTIRKLATQKQQQTQS